MKNLNDLGVLGLGTRLKRLSDFLYRQIDDVYKAEKIDFHARNFPLLQLLNENEYVRSECRKIYRFFLIDEFQDTNFFQWELLKPLLSNEKSSKLHQQKTFIVGDPKQSIYSFRNAEVAVFKEITEKIKSENLYSKDYITPEHFQTIESTETERKGSLALTDNYRSQTSQLHFLNDLFKPIFEYKESEFDVDFLPLNPQKEEKSNSDIQLFLGSTANNDEEYRYITYQILNALKEGYSLKDIAILFRKRSDKISQLENIFRENNIPFQNHLGQSFYRTEEIKDCYNIIKFSCYPDDDVSLFGILASSFYHFSESALYNIRQNKKVSLWENLKASEAYQEIVSELKYMLTLSKRIPIDLFLNEVFNISDYLTRLESQKSEQILANIEKFISIAQDFSSTGFRDVYDFERFLFAHIESETKEAEAEIISAELDNKVQLMTVHASKGLEFKLVIYPHINDPIRPNYTNTLYIDRIQNETILYPKIIGSDDKGFIESYLKARFEMRSLAEEKRIFYVALTRVIDN